jgi:hypothetical protein
LDYLGALDYQSPQVSSAVVPRYIIRTACSLALLPVLAACGANKQGPQAPGTTRSGKSPPQWMQIATFSGSGNASRTVEVKGNAPLWRTRWQCRSGELTMIVSSASSGAPMRVDERCPSVGKAGWTGAGKQRLEVRATDSWRVAVEEYAPGRPS